MNSQLRLGVVLPIVLFAALATAVGLFMLSRGQQSSATSESALPLPTHIPTAPKTAPKTAPAAKPKPAAKAQPSRPPKPAVELRTGLPAALAKALTARPVAVVSLVAPGAELDTMAAKEAAAGARAAGAAFTTVNVASEAEAKPFALMLGVLDAPGVIVFKRPGEVFVQLDGFADRDTVAQAADNATS